MFLLRLILALKASFVDRCWVSDSGGSWESWAEVVKDLMEVVWRGGERRNLGIHIRGTEGARNSSIVASRSC